MTLSIPTQEALSFARAASDKIVTLRVVSSDTLAVGIEMKVKIPLFGEKSKIIEIYLQIDRIQGEDIIVRCNSDGFALNLIIKGLLSAFSIYGTSPIVEILEGGQVVVHLREVEKLRDVLDKITINSVSFENNSALVNFNLKSL